MDRKTTLPPLTWRRPCDSCDLQVEEGTGSWWWPLVTSWLCTTFQDRVGVPHQCERELFFVTPKASIKEVTTFRLHAVLLAPQFHFLLLLQLKQINEASEPLEISTIYYLLIILCWIWNVFILNCWTTDNPSWKCLSCHGLTTSGSESGSPQSYKVQEEMIFMDFLRTFCTRSAQQQATAVWSQGFSIWSPALAWLLRLPAACRSLAYVHFREKRTCPKMLIQTFCLTVSWWLNSWRQSWIGWFRRISTRKAMVLLQGPCCTQRFGLWWGATPWPSLSDLTWITHTAKKPKEDKSWQVSQQFPIC